MKKYYFACINSCSLDLMKLLMISSLSPTQGTVGLMSYDSITKRKNDSNSVSNTLCNMLIAIKWLMRWFNNDF